MGLMKLVRTAHTNGWRAGDPVEQAAWNAVIARERRYREFHSTAQRGEGHSAIETFYLRTDYVGWMPSEPGRYLVVDLTSNRQTFVQMNEAKKVTDISSPHQTMDLSIYAQRYYRWFRLSSLSSDDIKQIRELPIVKEEQIPPILEAEVEVTGESS